MKLRGQILHERNVKLKTLKSNSSFSECSLVLSEANYFSASKYISTVLQPSNRHWNVWGIFTGYLI